MNLCIVVWNGRLVPVASFFHYSLMASFKLYATCFLFYCVCSFLVYANIKRKISITLYTLLVV